MTPFGPSGYADCAPFLLNQIIEWRGAPKAIRVDNGPEYVSGTLMEWADKRAIGLKRFHLFMRCIQRRRRNSIIRLA
jgi:transposase InsO family protein